ncbi:hypothetical protein Uis1B_2251 [Bifidobacterium margollesii]|uniref:Uncharacterized protein n=4 Tax=Bifidobacterium margollesii TaxID=2020964 RepID=A0A2N5J6S8_9BIFI|nr:hypothetical protein Uis1B_2251 [Bifidobacterium margollesii]
MTGRGGGPIGPRDTPGRLLALCLCRIAYATGMLAGITIARDGLDSVITTVGPAADTLTTGAAADVLTGVILLLGAGLIAMGCAEYDEWIHDPMKRDLR